MLRKGDILNLVTAGGAGYGPPDKRDPAAVLRDVEQGYLTFETAHKFYGDRFKALQG
jgi:N-methylhydantoinase B